VGEKDVEDALEKLDVLTKEEISMTVARNLQLAHDVDGNVTVIKDVIGGVDSSVKQTEALTEVIDANVKTTKALAEVVGNDVKVIDHNVRAAKHSTRLFSLYPRALTDRFVSQPATDELKRLLLSYTSIFDPYN
jgi:Ni2+-binding GTPase involved in maturation of urease and hydrogenase